jgi:23S rRNA (adenine2030-N6)-methyltransferase
LNYRHQFHAGNFADVMKHVLLVQLVAALQRKEKGFVYVDTHAGRGRYDLSIAAVGDSLARRPEWPEGIGRIWTATALPPSVATYLDLVKACDRQGGNLVAEPRFYPGSPWLVQRLLRPVDRMVLCERHEAECQALRLVSAGWPRCEVRTADGYATLRAVLPPPERRALVLLDPPYERQDEFSLTAGALAEGLRRLPGAVMAAWYPLTSRARVEEFHSAVAALQPPSAFIAELAVAGEDDGLKMRGCGLLVLNAPWQFDATAGAALTSLASALAQTPRASGRASWLIAPR